MNVKKESTCRIYYMTGGTTNDIYINGHSAQNAVDRVLDIDSDADIIDVSKIVYNWKGKKHD